MFDLDGTLVDTAPDMVATLNRILTRHHQATVAYEQARLVVSSGARALIRLGFEGPLTAAAETDLINEFLQDYAEHVCEQSQLYPQMANILAACEDQQIPWAVITNKPVELAKNVLSGLDLLSRCKVLLGGDSLPVKKPDPVPLLHCAMLLSVAPSECLYIGDHVRDIEAARQAGMESAIATWGYIEESEDLTAWQADLTFTSTLECAQFVNDCLPN